VKSKASHNNNKTEKKARDKRGTETETETIIIPKECKKQKEHLVLA